MTGSRAHVSSDAVARYSVVKTFDDLPCSHRAWAQDGRCQFLHGYARSFEIEFACTELEAGTGFVVDFSRLKSVRSLLQAQFDHTTLIAVDDPERELFAHLHDRGIIDMRVMDQTGMEGSAAWCLAHVGELIAQETHGRVHVRSILVRESGKNVVRLLADHDAPRSPA